MKLADQRRQIDEIEEKPPAHDARLGGAAWRAGSRPSRRASRRGRSCSRTSRTSRPAASATCRSRTAASSPQGYAPTKHTVKMTATVKAPRITAFRLELLNDPNLPLGGPGRSFKGTDALTEFGVEARRRRQHGQAGAREVRQGHRRLRRRTGDAARAELRRQVGQEARHRAGRASPSTARTRPPGASTPGRAAATCRARPSSRSTTPIVRATGTQLIFLLKQNHGGWNSDDLMNNNLGRFRLSYTAAANPVADPLPQGRARHPGDPRREALARADRTPSSATGGRPCRRSKDANDEDRGARQAASRAVDVAAGARGPHRDARHAHAQARRLAEPRQGDHAGRPGRAASAAAGRAADAPDAGASGSSIRSRRRRAGVRQPRLAGLLRHRPGRDQRGLRHAERGAVAPRAARLAGRRVHGQRLERRRICTG